jgi:hypothetical protein
MTGNDTNTKGTTMNSTYYKLVDRTTGQIVAEGSRKEMHRLRKRQKDGSLFVGITSKRVGENWNDK